jgi:hypothetical protein
MLDILRLLVLSKETVFRKPAQRSLSSKSIKYTIMKPLRSGMSNIFGKGPQQILWVCSLAANVKIAKVAKLMAKIFVFLYYIIKWTRLEDAMEWK